MMKDKKPYRVKNEWMSCGDKGIMELGEQEVGEMLTKDGHHW